MSSGDPSPVGFLTDPLSSIARAERRNLLIASVVGILVADVGLVPTRFSTFGLEFKPPEQSAFIWIVIALVVYFAVAFVLYGLADLLIWQTKYQHYLERVEEISKHWTQEDEEAHDERRRAVPDYRLWRFWTPTAFIRVAFEFVPMLVAIYAVIALLRLLRTV